MNTPKRKIKVRIMAFMLIFVFVIGALVVRTGWLQVVDGAQLKKEATQQQTRDKIINSKRGAILDRNGKELAVSASVEMVTVAPNEIKEAKSAELVSEKLADILSMSYEDIYKKVTKNSAYEIVKRKVEKQQTDQIRELMAAKETKAAFAGVSLEEDTKRYYPFGNFASHVIGFTGTDNQGLYGLEKAYDEQLRGTAGRVISAKNAIGVEMPFKYEEKYDSQDGRNVVLTLDETIQHFAEKHLEQAVVENKPTMGASVIVADPNTGEILAMATKPDFDLNEPFTITDTDVLSQIESLPAEEQSKARSDALDKIWRNKAVSDTYEPGSVFKILTAAMGLEEGVVTPTDNFNCSGGVKVGGRTIHCWRTIGHGAETFKDGFKNSCNPVFMAVGERVGADRFFQYFKNFGLDAKTGFDIVGESESVFHKRENFHEVELATSSFGQSFQVTPLQMVAAVSAVVNGGMLYRPHIVKELQDSEGNVVESVDTTPVRQVVSEETSATMREFLEYVVSDGTGKNAYIKGFRVGGKTGTSEKQPRDQGKYVASFLGIAPANDPKVLVLVTIDEPTGDLHQGSQIAAPVVRDIIEDTLRYMGVEQQFSAEELATMQATVPEVRGLGVTEAKAQLTNEGFGVKVVGNGDTVLEQLPKPTASLSKSSNVILYTEDAEASKVTVPDVTGMNIDQARRTLIDAGLNMEILGSSADDSSNTPALKQDPVAGTEVSPATTVRVEFTYMDGD